MPLNCSYDKCTSASLYKGNNKADYIIFFLEIQLSLNVDNMLLYMG